MRIVWRGVDTVVVPKGQAIPDHTVSILSSGTSAAEASAVAVGTVRVASATGIGRLFLRDIRVPGAVAARRCGCWLQPVQPIPTENPLSRPACHPGQPSAAEPPFDPLWCHLVQPGARFGHLPSPRALAGRMERAGTVPRSRREQKRVILRLMPVCTADDQARNAQRGRITAGGSDGCIRCNQFRWRSRSAVLGVTRCNPARLSHLLIHFGVTRCNAHGKAGPAWRGTGPDRFDPAGQLLTIVLPLAVFAALNTASVSSLNFGPCIAATPEYP